MYVGDAETSYQLGPWRRTPKVVAFVDIVESVRLLELDEESVLGRWHALLAAIRPEVLPRHDGVLAQIMGDGALLVFEEPAAAVQAVRSIFTLNEDGNRSVPRDRRIALRSGIEFSEVIVSGTQVYGRGVNRASRLTSLAAPGDIVLSQAARDALPASLRARAADIGKCFVRHGREPVAAYRLPGSDARPPRRPPFEIGRLKVTLGVAPLMLAGVPADRCGLGQALEDEIRRGLSTSFNIELVPYPSAAAPDGDRQAVAAAGRSGVDYILTGTYAAFADVVHCSLGLVDVTARRYVMHRRFRTDLRRLWADDAGIGGQVARQIEIGVQGSEWQRCRSLPLATLKPASLLVAARALMNTLSPEAFATSRRLLEVLVGRATRQSLPQAWLAYWHLMRVLQGWSSSPEEDTALAEACIRTALEADPQCATALAIDGLVQTNLLRRLDTAETRYHEALQADPGNAFARIARGMFHASTDRGDAAVADTEQAMQNAVTDNFLYFFECLAASSYFTAKRYKKAIDIAKSSRRSNHFHVSTLRVLVASEWQFGQHHQAKRHVEEILTIRPSFTLQDYHKRLPSAHYEVGRLLISALSQAGVPA